LQLDSQKYNLNAIFNAVKYQRASVQWFKTEMTTMDIFMMDPVHLFTALFVITAFFSTGSWWLRGAS
jgi:hypothetical protein